VDFLLGIAAHPADDDDDDDARCARSMEREAPLQHAAGPEASSHWIGVRCDRDCSSGADIGEPDGTVICSSARPKLTAD